MTSDEKGYGLPNLKCFERLHANVVRRLGQNWEYTGKIYPNDIKEHIRYFINLCNKEGHVESASSNRAVSSTALIIFACLDVAVSTSTIF